MKEALFYRKLDKDVVQCDLCPHNCRIPKDGLGVCRVRKNDNGTLVSLNAERVIASHSDPIEKKPLYHFFPGIWTFSIAAAGCNLHCTNCQNHTISQANEALLSEGQPSSPSDMVTAARQAGLKHMTFTYTEPTVFYELMLETARLATDAGLICSVVSNGFINPEPLKQLIPFISAANIDLKFASDHLYRTITGGSSGPVAETIRLLFEHNVITEVTTLVIPGLNDSPEEFEAITKILLNISPDIPWHLSAFYPTYRMQDRPPTPPEMLKQLRLRARGMGLQYVYTGNILDSEGSTTYCPNCQSTLVYRARLSSLESRVSNGHCPDCGTEIYGRFD